MMCPHCQIEFNADHWGACPHCGDPRNQRQDASGIDGVIKTSTILISGEDGGVFRSLDEVPEPLRQILVATTNSVNSATIVIADQGGRDRIAAALKNLPRGQGMDSALVPLPPANPHILTRMAVSKLWLYGFISLAAAAAVAWIVYTRLL